MSVHVLQGCGCSNQTVIAPTATEDRIASTDVALSQSHSPGGAISTRRSPKMPLAAMRMSEMHTRASAFASC